MAFIDPDTVAEKKPFIDPDSIQTPSQVQAPSTAPKSYTWGQVPGAALSNAPAGLWDYAKAFVDPETYKGMYSMMVSGNPGSALTNYVTTGQLPYQNLLEAAKNLATQKIQEYGSIEDLKRTIAENPITALTDLASILMGAGGTIPKAGMIGKVGQYLDPLTAAAQGVGKVVSPLKGTISGPLGITTGGGQKVIEEAMEGRPAFKKALRGGISGEEVVQEARGGLNQLKQERVNQYKPRLDSIKNATITPTMDMTVPMKEFKTQLTNYGIKPIKDQYGRWVSLDFSRSPLKNNLAAQSDFNKMLTTISDAMKDPGFYQTPFGYDTLKRQLFDLYSESGDGRAAVERIGQSVRQELINKVPGYETMVGDYEKTGKIIKEIENTLSLDKKKPVDTALRKLNLAMREDDDFRRSLIKQVEATSGKDISGMVSGRLLSTWMPKSWMGKEIAAGTIIASLFGNPAIIPALATASPRLVAETLMLLNKPKQAIKVMSSPSTAGVRETIQKSKEATEANQ